MENSNTICYKKITYLSKIISTPEHFQKYAVKFYVSNAALTIQQKDQRNSAVTPKSYQTNIKNKETVSKSKNS